MKEAKPQNVKAFVLALLCLALGWLAHTPETIELQAPPQSAPPCVEVASRPTYKKRELAGPAAAQAPALHGDMERLRACFTGAHYRGSAFALHLTTGHRGEVKRVALAGDEFMEPSERGCVQRRAREWTFGENVEKDVVVKVVL